MSMIIHHCLNRHILNYNYSNIFQYLKIKLEKKKLQYQELNDSAY
jgi:hypothetical protein